MKRCDLVLDPTGECDCCRLEHPGGKFVLLEDHASAIAEKDEEIAALKRELEQQMPHRVRLSTDLAAAVEVLGERDAEIARLRKVVEAARIVDRDGLIYSESEADILRNALAELDGTAS